MTPSKVKKTRELLDPLVDYYNRPDFIEDDPISIPHSFQKQQDIEISGLFAAVFSWGQRKTIINKSAELMERMDGAPYAFVTGHSEADLQKLIGFRHRTFNDTDLLYFVAFLKSHFTRYDSLEDAFLPSEAVETSQFITSGLNQFRERFFSLEDFPPRTIKHISSPAQHSACKRMNMFLRWMVRQDDRGVDFGIWKRISPAALLCPLDLHVNRIAQKTGLLWRKQPDFKAVEELTGNLRLLDAEDPVRYDFALFGSGIKQGSAISG